VVIGGFDEVKYETLNDCFTISFEEDTDDESLNAEFRDNLPPMPA
jgi:hypothetical protein